MITRDTYLDGGTVRRIERMTARQIFTITLVIATVVYLASWYGSTKYPHHPRHTPTTTIAGTPLVYTAQICSTAGCWWVDGNGHPVEKVPALWHP